VTLGLIVLEATYVFNAFFFFTFICLLQNGVKKEKIDNM